MRHAECCAVGVDLSHCLANIDTNVALWDKSSPGKLTRFQRRAAAKAATTKARRGNNAGH